LFSDYVYYDWLLSWGVTTNKTKYGMPWVDFGVDQRHFVRGFTDGDGSIRLLRCGIYSYPRIEWGIKVNCALVCGLVSRYPSARYYASNGKVVINGKAAVVVMNEIYRNCDWFMARKLFAAQEFICHD
jgi:hypothetical protein